MVTVTCPCGVEFEARSTRAKWHSPACKKRHQRGAVASPPAKKRAAKKTTAAAKTAVKSNAMPKDDEHAFVTATRKELAGLDAADTMLGHQVLTIAERMGRGAETGAAMASLSKEHSRLMAEIRARSKGKEEDPVEAARRARAEKASRASQG